MILVLESKVNILVPKVVLMCVDVCLNEINKDDRVYIATVGWVIYIYAGNFYVFLFLLIALLFFLLLLFFFFLLPTSIPFSTLFSNSTNYYSTIFFDEYFFAVIMPIAITCILQSKHKQLLLIDIPSCSISSLFCAFHSSSSVHFSSDSDSFSVYFTKHF